MGQVININANLVTPDVKELLQSQQSVGQHLNAVPTDATPRKSANRFSRLLENMITLLANCNKGITDDVRNQLSNYLKEAQKKFMRITGKYVRGEKSSLQTESEDTAQLDEAYTDALQTWESAFPAIPFVAVGVNEAINTVRNEVLRLKDFDSKHQVLLNTSDARMKAFDLHQERAKILLETLSTTEKQRKVKQFGDQFKSWADIQAGTAVVYLLLAIATLVATAWFVIIPPEAIGLALATTSKSVAEAAAADTNSTLALVLFSFRITALIVGITLFAFFARHFSATRHIWLVTRHRQKIAELYLALRLDDEMDKGLLVSVLSVIVQEPSSPFLKHSRQDEEMDSIPGRVMADVADKIARR